MEREDPTQIPIETAGPADAAKIAEVYVAARAEALPHLHRIRDDDADRDWICNSVLQRGQTWVARARGDIVGFLVLVGDDDVDQLYLAPGWYRRGIGSMLLERAKAASAGRLRLYTFQSNLGARAFYQRHGFRPIRFGDGSLNEEKEPDILYQWSREG